MTRPAAAHFEGAPALAFDDPGAGVEVPTDTPTVLAAQTRYAIATEITPTGSMAAGGRITLRAAAGDAWAYGWVTDKKTGKRQKQKVNKAKATAAELAQLRWRVHCGGELLIDQRPGAMSDTLTLTLPKHLKGETVVAWAYNDEPSVAQGEAWWVEDPRVPGGKRNGRGSVLQDVDQFARIMGYASVRDADTQKADLVRAAFPLFVRGFAARGLDTLQQCHFLAQVAHETLKLTLLREDRSDASAAKKYATSNGNAGPADGAAFKGRGVLQTTGYLGYRAYFVGVEDAQDVSRATLRRRAPELEALPDAVDAGLFFWGPNVKRCHDRAAIDDALGVSIRVNGWNRPEFLPNHYPERLRALDRAKRELGLAR